MMKNLMKNNLLLFLIAVVVSLLGCVGGTRSKSGLEYSFCRETRSRTVSFRATLKPADVSNLVLSKGWGNIEWMADEGRHVASGDLILKINMETTEDRVRRHEKDLKSQEDQFVRIEKALPAEKADLELALLNKKLELKRAIFERNLLFKPKNDGEVWKIQSDLRSAEIGFSLAGKLHELKKNVTEKGFDSPFSLRSSEIDKQSREIELDYAGRMLAQLGKPPLAEELAQIDFQKTVASGEIWLAENRLISASISAEIRKKNLEVVLDRIGRNFREANSTLEEAIQHAPRAGVVFHPVLWGDFRFRPGQQVWPGVSILQVIVSGQYYLEALLPERKVHDLTDKASASIFLDSMPGKIFQGQIKSIGKAPKPIRGLNKSALRFLPVEVSINASESLPFGDKAEVRVRLQEVEGVFLPRDLLEKKSDKNQVQVMVKTRFGADTVTIEYEDFDQDWVVWKNPPQPQGILVFP